MFVDSRLPHMNMSDFIRHYNEASLHQCEICSTGLPQSTNNPDSVQARKPDPLDNMTPGDEGGTDSLNSVDSGVVTAQNEIKVPSKLDNEEPDRCIKQSREKSDSPRDMGDSPRDIGVSRGETGFSGEDAGDSPDHCERCAALRLLRKQPGDTSDGLLDLVDSLDAIDNSTGILHVLFLLLEGLAGAVSSCPKSYQPETLEMLFQLLRTTADVPG